MIVVRPEQLEVLLREVAPCLRSTALVVSFVAKSDTGELQKALARPVACAVADPEWQEGAYCLDDEADAPQFVWLPGLTAVPMWKSGNTLDFRAYTLLMCHKHAAVLLAASGSIGNLEEHLSFLTGRLVALGVPALHLQLHVSKDPLRQLRTLATPGGITEKFTAALKKHTDPKTVYETVESQARR
jgi:pyrroline-5-carboxylate reductase